MPQMSRQKPLRKQILLAMRFGSVPLVDNSVQQVQSHRAFNEILWKLRLSTWEIGTKRMFSEN
jgi:hypothetical protein